MYNFQKRLFDDLDTLNSRWVSSKMCMSKGFALKFVCIWLNEKKTSKTVQYKNGRLFIFNLLNCCLHESLKSDFVTCITSFGIQKTDGIRQVSSKYNATRLLDQIDTLETSS